ncbi:polysaccharide deacetylase family protein [Winogradskya humida]|uniref:polysaccharide deacetylase family protein n=1 Tax=Winogradskya humida TaxID=113566 RepID=UPI0019445D57|nr:polysaccharide deacetylase family protein [Actinoplanes humidus]
MSLFGAAALLLATGPAAPAAPVKPAAQAPERSPRAYGPAVPKQARTVALTFDDGPSRYTPQILAVLRRHHVHATFCMLGDEARRYPELARQVVAEGHQVCNHSRDHANLQKASTAKVRAEVTKAQKQIKKATEVTPKVFRFPYGASDSQARKVVHGYGLRVLGWNVDPEDWTRPPAKKITTRITAHVKNGSVVLMHDGGGDRSHTAASLEATITRLRARGYTFVLA